MVNHPRSFARRETPMPKVSPYPLSHLVSAVTVQFQTWSVFFDVLPMTRKSLRVPPLAEIRFRFYDQEGPADLRCLELAGAAGQPLLVVRFMTHPARLTCLAFITETLLMREAEQRVG